MNHLIAVSERCVFRARKLFLSVIALITVVLGWFGSQLHMEAGFEKQMPQGHEYIQTVEKYGKNLYGENRLTVVVKSKKGSIFTKAGLTRLYEVTQAITYLPGVDRMGVQSLWTPNVFVNEITEEGFRAQPVIDGTVTPKSLNEAQIEAIRKSAAQGGFIGTLVSRDQSSAMVTASIAESTPEAGKIDYVAYGKLIESRVRSLEDDEFQIEIIGFAKQISDVAEGASSVAEFCAIALVLTALAVYWYSQSLRLTLLPIACSLTSLIWQFGTLKIMGYGLDPLAVLVPFLVFSIGVSHGVQQINFIVREIASGKSTMEAARSSFTGLLVPGTLALLTAFVSFVTLMLVPIPMVKELAVVSSIGVAYKIITNLFMLPVAASFFSFTPEFAKTSLAKKERRSQWVSVLAKVAKPRNALVVSCLTLAVFGAAVWESRDRVVGTLQPGAPELRLDSRYNRDAVDIASNFDVGLDWLTVVFEGPNQACTNVSLGKYQEDFVAAMGEVDGVQAIQSFAGQLIIYNRGYNEGNPKMAVVPADPGNYAGLAAEIARVKGFALGDCTMTAVHFFLADHKATTLHRVIDEIKAWREHNVLPGVTIRLAAGNAGVQAAIDDAVEKAELPMLLYVYASIAVLVVLAYRDLRAVAACCLPLTVGTFIGYWFMKTQEIGLTVATLPVMVLAVGVGVDYAFYIYNRLQWHMGQGRGIVESLENAFSEVGVATIFTAITLAIGVATWSFSDLKFQADMGKLLAFMFLINLVMAMTALPAFAVLLERLFPRKRAVHVSGVLSH